MRQLNIENKDYVPKDIYLQDINTLTLLSVEEEEIIVKQIKSNDQKVFEKLIIENLPLVVCVAKRFEHRGLTLHYLIIYGNLGLIKATECFDEKSEFKFISYAIWCIRQSILQAIVENLNIKPIPLNKIGLIWKVNSTNTKLEQYFQLEPTTKEIAGMLEFQNSIFKDVLDPTITKKYNLA